jgi:hypothetical protein
MSSANEAQAEDMISSLQGKEGGKKGTKRKEYAPQVLCFGCM